MRRVILIGLLWLTATPTPWTQQPRTHDLALTPEHVHWGTFFWIDPKADMVAMVWTQFNTGRVYPLERDFQRLVYAAVLK